MPEKRWYVVYTKPRWEKKVSELLKRKGIEHYCPMNKVRKKWSDRYKIIEEPLFKSYLFVHIEETEQSSIRFVEGVVNYVYWLGKPAIVRNDEIEKIKRFLNEYSDIKVISIDQINRGSVVMINSGVFMDLKAVVVEDRVKTVILEIISLGIRLVATVPKEYVSLLEKSQK
ncbi:UpxY family transcription antiterminator [Flavihumibacter sediminis]|nr:UpxY family transcription antiterminator [Flavihumibacter sediminis]